MVNETSVVLGRDGYRASDSKSLSHTDADQWLAGQENGTAWLTYFKHAP